MECTTELQPHGHEYICPSPNNLKVYRTLLCSTDEAVLRWFIYVNNMSEHTILATNTSNTTINISGMVANVLMSDLNNGSLSKLHIMLSQDILPVTIYCDRNKGLLFYSLDIKGKTNINNTVLAIRS